MARAQARGWHDTYNAALKRLTALIGREETDALAADFQRMLGVREALLEAKHGRKQRASRTRDMLARKGEVEILSQWALAAKPTDGFTDFLDHGVPEYTGEAIVVRHAMRFAPHVVDAARRRLQQFGVADRI